jgi:hypothetical protein
MKKCNGTSLLGWRELLSDSEFGERKSLGCWIDINGSFVYKKKFPCWVNSSRNNDRLLKKDHFKIASLITKP